MNHLPAHRYRLLLAFALFSCTSVNAQFSEESLSEVRDYYRQLDSAALVVLHKGKPVISWGNVDEKYNVASIRKSLLNSLYGIGFDRGWIDPQRTLAEIGIDDRDPPLTEQEKSATLQDLLRSRSGIVHKSLYEAGWWDEMPPRGTYKPGEYWIYNNWDFNALGTIWESETGRTIHQAFGEFIAEPLGLQDFEESDVSYYTRRNLAERMRGNKSDHNLYIFRMTARDLATFGQLYLNRGEWDGNQILSSQWIDRTMNGIPTEFESRRFDTGYGYLWWIDEGEHRRFKVPNVMGAAQVATGARGHYIYLAPECDLVVAHTVQTPLGAGFISQLRRRFFGSEGIQDWQFTQLLELIINAGPDLVC